MAHQPTTPARKSESKGAAEEPEPEPDGSLSSSTTASYDPSVFQRPHPDDRGGADGTPRKKGHGKAKSKAKAQGKTKDGKGKAVGRCGNCAAEGATRRCSQCGTEVYCDEKCQRVSGRVSARGGGAMAVTPGALSRPPHRSPPAPRRSTGSTAATRRRARPTYSPTPSRRSSSGCARRRSRQISA